MEMSWKIRENVMNLHCFEKVVTIVDKIGDIFN